MKTKTVKSPASRTSIALFTIVLASVAFACQVPVFRYALERWPADNYELVVLHDGPLSDAEQKTVKRLRDSDHQSPTSANAEIKLVDVKKASDRLLKSTWAEHGQAGHSVFAALYPKTAAEVPDRLISASPLGENALNNIIDSPTRQTIAKRLVSGESAVWIFVPIGDEKVDKPALETLQRVLEANQRDLELPVQDEIEEEEELLEQVDIELRLSFSTVTLKRDDPKEQFLLQMLLASEPDLQELKQPMAFPVLGRGRVLYALVGKGIAEHTITLASRFIIGPCSCQVKNQNPGFDLLMAADWDKRIGKTKLSDPLPEQPDKPVLLTIP